MGILEVRLENADRQMVVKKRRVVVHAAPSRQPHSCCRAGYGSHLKIGMLKADKSMHERSDVCSRSTEDQAGGATREIDI